MTSKFLTFSIYVVPIQDQKTPRRISNKNAMEEIFESISKTLLRGRYRKKKHKEQRRAILIGDMTSDNIFENQQLTVKRKTKSGLGVITFTKKLFTKH